MELKYFGANCVKLFTKKATVVIDDNLATLGKKKLATAKDISIHTNKEFSVEEDNFLINSPGEYELSEVSVKGIPTKLHYDPEKPAVMYTIYVNGISVAVLGHTVPELSDIQEEALGVVDVLIIPIGGGGYTLDSVEAIKIIKDLEPKIVVPTHFESKTLNYQVPQASADELLKALSVTEPERVDSLKIKDGNLPEKTRVVILEEQ